ncbi:hypothetical protein E4U13_004913 [Claviceps humidiphila]|uniref:Cyanovirin-N domain-containing protein n=1 Tax=Claviceps humidiphila TaxID=1294629 RepID=A0A9P7PWU5_9HYPO|nr:hypothetical protein E4U13_004913 [Claviceps humidiphila]
MHALSLLALLLPLAAADGPSSCDCMSWSKGQSWIHNQMLSYFVCWNDYKGLAKFNLNTNRCEVLPGQSIDSGTFELHCKAAGLGYFPITMDGHMDASGTPIHVDEATVSCN